MTVNFDRTSIFCRERFKNKIIAVKARIKINEVIQ